MEIISPQKNRILPDFFRPILWSYDFSAIKPEKDKKTIIVNAINYGDLVHWRWINKYYSREIIKKILEQIPVSEIRPRVLRLATLIFSLDNLNYAPRGVKE